jgi:hypothetical protein
MASQNKEDSRARTPVEVKRSAPAPVGIGVPTTDPWPAFRNEIERLFDRFGFNMKPLRNWFDLEPSFQVRTGFEMASPAIDIVAEQNGYKLTAELPGMPEKDVELVRSAGGRPGRSFRHSVRAVVPGRDNGRAGHHRD